MQKQLCTGLVLALCHLSAAQAEPTAITLGAGAIEFASEDSEAMLELGLEGAPIERLWAVQPYASLLLADDTWYLSGGALKQFPLRPGWHWGAGISAGYYDSGDAAFDLGHELEFKSRLFLGYELDADAQLRLEVGHISNADLDEKNPGADYLLLNWIKQL